MNLMKHARRRNPQPLPLFVWADTHPELVLPLAVYRVARKYRLNPVRARLVAELLGYPMEGRE